MDLLLSSAGAGRLTRFFPVPRRDSATVYGSIMAYRSDAGSLRIAAFPNTSGVPSDPEALTADVARRGLVFTLAAAHGAETGSPSGGSR